MENTSVSAPKTSCETPGDQNLLVYLAAQELVQIGQWEPGYEVDYSQIDLELREVIKMLNQIDGVGTVDSCFGHPEDPSMHQNQHLEAFIGLTCTDAQRFTNFWQFVLSYTHGQWGKIYLCEGNRSGFVVSSNLYLYPGTGSFMTRLTIAPFNRNLARIEKLAGVWFLSQLAVAYRDGRRPEPGELGIDNLLLSIPAQIDDL
jgi:hypothetical protein